MNELSVFVDEAGVFGPYDYRDPYYILYGQVPIARMLSTVFRFMLSNVEFKRVIPSEYRLFQISDMLCTLELIELKLNTKTMSRSEKAFFDYDDRMLKKHYLKVIQSKIL